MWSRVFVILALQEAEAGRLEVRAQPQGFSETLSQKRSHGGEGVAWWEDPGFSPRYPSPKSFQCPLRCPGPWEGGVEGCLPGVCQALGSVVSTADIEVNTQPLRYVLLRILTPSPRCGLSSSPSMRNQRAGELSRRLNLGPKACALAHHLLTSRIRNHCVLIQPFLN